ncbi:MAG: cytoplasmic protein [Candidatus Aureabacteria bacterium]|nr:cytoplasmic protein [Candidatus Auribacterota bacterium]
MGEHDLKGMSEIRVDIGNLYREESITDLKVATLRRLNPITADGSPDPSRPPIFIGQAHVMTAAGPLPVNCPIDATTLEEAIGKFPDAVHQGVERMVAELKQMQREEASRIIVPN